MARFFVFSIVCASFFTSSAQVARIPYAPVPAEEAHDLTKHFSHPVGFHTWEFYGDTADAWKRWEMVENFSFGKNRGAIPMIADLQSLHPYFRDKVIELIRVCKSKGIELAVVETYRTHAKQNEYRSMGKHYTRSKAGYSKHQYGLAVDIVPMKDTVAQWNNIALWRKVGVIGERLGLRWGGRWRHLFDPGHFEWTGGLGSSQLVQGKFPIVPKSAHYPCVDEDLKELQRHWKAWEIEQAAVARKETTPGIKSFAAKSGDQGAGRE
ncbi:MAG: M15 family metallopeptidase [Cyclobacteriaceae bacterium]|nr:M15 family metallopeptidase [Cyclobacteriaceae bacterium]